MSATFGATRAEQAGGVTIPQISDLIERVMQECQATGTDPALVEPKVQVSIGGKVKRITVEVP